MSDQNQYAHNIHDTKRLKLLTILRLGLSQDCVSPICSCGQDIETTIHFLLHCPNHHCARKNFFHKINKRMKTSQDRVILLLQRFGYSVTIN